MKSLEPKTLLAICLLGLASANAHADLITGIESIVDANTTTFSGFGGTFFVNGGPLAGVTLNGLNVTTRCLGTNPESACTSGFVYGDAGFNPDASFNFFDNGRWLPGFAGVGAIDYSGIGGFKVDLGANYSAVGAFVNTSWDGFQRDTGFPGASGNASITALDENFAILATYNLRNQAQIFGAPTYGMDGPFPESRNFTNEAAGAFRGITRETADIRYLMFTGSFLFANSITVGSVPEPATLGLLGLGLAGVGLARRRTARAVRRYNHS